MRSDAVAVIGAGTMGAGIAQAALGAGVPVVLYDVSAQALERARQRVATGLEKQGRSAGLNRLRCTSDLPEIGGVALAIEAAPELLDLKRELFVQLGAICDPPCVIASNTSSLPIAMLAAACRGPQRVAGLHFFNPVHRMALVEVVRTPQTDDATIAALLGFAERLGKTPVLARDTPGFIVNRVARPYYGEALRLLGEGSAGHEAIDMALRLAGGFPLGPFALMDLIGVDVNFAVTRSMYEQSFGEPRYRPHPLQQQMVLAGALGRKTGRGFYSYDDGHVPASEPSPAARQLAGYVLIGPGRWAPGLADLCAAAGLAVEMLESERPASVRQNSEMSSDSLRAAFVAAGRGEGALDSVRGLDLLLDPAVPILAQCADVSACELAAPLRHPERLVGFDGLFTAGAFTLVATPLLAAGPRSAAEELVRGLGRLPIWIGDTPALIVPRVITTLVNEAAFAVGEGVADAATVDLAMRLGANHPVGPFARAEALGYARVVTLLDHLYAQYHEERYRVAPLLRRAAWIGQLQ